MPANNSSNKKRKTVLWSCTWCGAKEMKNSVFGRPQPGRCPRKSGDRPHTWVKEREF